jgi:hypothetical protein
MGDVGCQEGRQEAAKKAKAAKNLGRQEAKKTKKLAK